MKFSAMSLITDDVAAAVTFFREVLELDVNGDDGFAEVKVDDVAISVMRGAMVPIGEPDGVILQFEVDDVVATLESARGRGGKVLAETTLTDWGTESAYLQGPGGIVVELFRNVQGAH